MFIILNLDVSTPICLQRLIWLDYKVIWNVLVKNGLTKNSSYKEDSKCFLLGL